MCSQAWRTKNLGKRQMKRKKKNTKRGKNTQCTFISDHSELHSQCKEQLIPRKHSLYPFSSLLLSFHVVYSFLHHHSLLVERCSLFLTHYKLSDDVPYCISVALKVFCIGPLVGRYEKSITLTLCNFKLRFFFSIKHSRAGDCLNLNRGEGFQFQHQYLCGQQFYGKSCRGCSRERTTERHKQILFQLLTSAKSKYISGELKKYIFSCRKFTL